MRSHTLLIAAAALSLAGSAKSQTIENYVYDAHGRLTGVDRRYDNTKASATSYTYDATDNRMVRGEERFANHVAADRLASGERMVRGQFLTSPDGLKRLRFQPDGNLVLLNGSAPVWNLGTFGSQALTLVMGSDGNLILTGPDAPVVWATWTFMYPGAELVILNNCRLELRAGSTIPWSVGPFC